MRFFNLHYISFGYILIAVFIGLILYLVRTHRLIRMLSDVQYQSLMFPRFSWWRQGIRSVLLCVGWIALWIALLRPQIVSPEQHERYEEGRDVIIAVDISRSMFCHDTEPYRLACAKRKIMQLVHQLPSERVALIIFSGAALVQCPLTGDRGAFQLFVEALDPSLLSGGGTTAIDQAIQTAIALCEKKERRQKLMVLVTDGEDFSVDLSRAREQAEQIELRIAVLGVGTSLGAPIPILDDSGTIMGHERAEDGSVVLSKLHEPLLRSLAAQCNGLYCTMDTTGDQDIRTIADWVSVCDRERAAVAHGGLYDELHMWVSAIALIVLGVEWML